MTGEQLLDRIISISGAIAEGLNLTPVDQPFEQQAVTPQQWQYYLQQDFQQRQHLSAELKTLTRQLRLNLKQSQLMASPETRISHCPHLLETERTINHQSGSKRIH